jgi:hypothetical protein
MLNYHQTEKIIKILRGVDTGKKVVMMYAVSMGSVTPPFTTGDQNMVIWMLVMQSVSDNLKRRSCG